MKKLVIILPVVFLSVIIILGCAKKEESTKEELKINVLKSMKLASSAFADNNFIPAKYTCDGENASPPLEISGVPENAKSLVLIVDDPDAPAGDWVHWTLWNIPPQTKNILENSVPAGATEGITDFNRPGYGGPCPPSGVHHYQFKLYALDTMLDLGSNAVKKDIEKTMNGHILVQNTLVGLYQKN